MKYPTPEEIETADRVQCAKWMRFLPIASSDSELIAIEKIIARQKKVGFITVEISKQIGWKEVM